MRFRERSPNGDLTVHAVAGTYVVLLGMNVPQHVAKGLLGFAIKRTDHTENESYWLQGMRTFEATNPNPPGGSYFPTSESPIQDFLWSDFSAKTRHNYTYEIVGVRGTPKNLQLDASTSVSVQVETESDDHETHSVYFNRGVIGSQAYSRQFGKAPHELTGKQKQRAYAWLSRGLEEAMLAFIGQANSPRYALRAAVYEFNWDPVSAALGSAFKQCKDVRIVYDDRIPGGKKGADNRKRIAKAKAQFKKHGLTGRTVNDEDVTIPRTESPSYISHNKFIVLLDQGVPVAVWPGSTNFTESGIFGQSNVGHAVRDTNVAKAYHEYWKQLAGDPAQKDIVAYVDETTPTLTTYPPPRGTTPLFSPRADIEQLQWYADALGKKALVDCFTAAFGVNKLFLDVFQEKRDFLRYIFLEKWSVKKADAAGVRKALSQDPFVQVAVGATIPEGELAGWLQELTNTLSTNVRFTHNKFELVDPLGDDPVVVTGSANFSDASTTSNDENMLVIRGDKRVADIYLGEFMRLWRHHNFRDIVSRVNSKTGAEEHNYLVPDDSWAVGFFKAGTVKCRRREAFA